MATNTLIVNINFNPPHLKIIGPIRETTVEKLNAVLPTVTTSHRSSRAGAPKFAFEPQPPHWNCKLDGQYCDQVGESALFLAILDALEEEGGWKLSTTQSITMDDPDTLQQDFFTAYKFFFKRIM
jgi:hypothetical protein